MDVRDCGVWGWEIIGGVEELAGRDIILRPLYPYCLIVLYEQVHILYLQSLQSVISFLTFVVVKDI